jgi:hypothetical protein
MKRFSALAVALALAACQAPPQAKLTVTPSPEDLQQLGDLFGTLAEDAMDSLSMDAPTIGNADAYRQLAVGDLLTPVVETWAEFEGRFTTRARGRYEFDIPSFKLTKAANQPADLTVIHLSGKGTELLHDLTFQAKGFTPDGKHLALGASGDNALVLYGAKNLFTVWPTPLREAYPVTKALAAGFGPDAQHASSLTATLALGDAESSVAGVVTSLTMPIDLALESETAPKLLGKGKATWAVDPKKFEVTFSITANASWTFENGATLATPTLSHASAPHKISLAKEALFLLLFNGVHAAKNYLAKH